MTNPFNDSLAKKYCTQLIKNLDDYKCLDFERCKDFNKSNFSTNHLFEKNGCMFGILVCKDSQNNEILLKAFSGQYNGIWNIEGWCNPLLNIEEYNNLVAKTDPEIQEITNQIKKTPKSSTEYEILFEKRRKLSQNAFKKIQKLTEFTCADGTICKFDSSEELLPTGTGDCCAPKLLNEAFARKLQPISLAEFYYGKNTETKTNLQFYTPCDEKCKFILPLMLGLEILYKDEHIIVINKSAGVLSVPGRSKENQDCVVNRIKTLYPDCLEQPSVHRLDMDTSGIIVFALTKDAHKKLSMEFEKGETKKKYIAVLDGNIINEKNHFKIGDTGKIELPFRLDVENRPYQIYDEVHGKIGITEYKILAVKKNKNFKTTSNYVTYIEFTPKTGRTHQLRLHSAHEKGLGVPIVGDRLYGNAKSEYNNDNYGKNGLKNGRLLLHAFYLEFTHPESKERIFFQANPNF